MGVVGRALAAGAGVLLLFGAACGERSEPTGRSAPLYPVTISSGDDRPFEVERPATRIAVLSTGPAEIVRALGAGRRIAGFPVAPDGAIQLERLRRLRPDLIIASAGFDEQQLSRAEAVSGAPVYVAPGDSIREVERTITAIGLATGRPVAARRLIRTIEERRRRVAAALGRRPAVSVFLDTGLFSTVSDQSLAGDLIREAGGRNVAGPSPGPGAFDLDELAELDPDVYLATSDSHTTLESLRRNPKTRQLSALRNGRFAVIDVSLLEPGPRIGEGLDEIARALHPDAFR